MLVYIEKVEIWSGVSDLWFSNIQLKDVRGVVWISLLDFFCHFPDRQTDRQQNILLLSLSKVKSLIWVTQLKALSTLPPDFSYWKAKDLAAKRRYWEWELKIAMWRNWGDILAFPTPWGAWILQRGQGAAFNRVLPHLFSPQSTLLDFLLFIKLFVSVHFWICSYL